MKISDAAVQAAQDEYLRQGEKHNWSHSWPDAECMTAILTAALPFLTGVKVKALEWKDHEGGSLCVTDRRYDINIWMEGGKPLYVDVYTTMRRHDTLEAAKAAAQADYEARILSALEPSAGRAAVLEEGYRQGIEAAAKLIECGCKDLLHGKGECQFPGNCSLEDAAAIRALASHPVADKPDEAGAQGEGWMPRYRHKKRGTEYLLIGIGKMQADNWQVSREGFDQSIDMEEVAIYRSLDDGKIWVRPREEFEDGRFETLPTPPSSEVA